jgi:hypothetical protein
MKAIVRLLTVPTEQRDVRWIEEALAAAVQLEFATIPPYLYAAWSIDPADPDPGGYRGTITGIAVEEMTHLGIAANMLAGIGGTLDMRALAPRYPYPVELPMHVHHGLQVELRPLSRELLLHTFMAIEEPAVQLAQGELDFTPSHAETIGDFYQALSDRIGVVKPTFTTGLQFELPFFTDDTWIVGGVEQAQKLIALIKDQGEGTSMGPFESGSAGELAHFYQFGELFHGRRLSRTSPFRYDGEVLAFPQVRAGFPAGHHDLDGAAFDVAYNRMIDHLTAAWSGTPAAINDAVSDMIGSATGAGLGELAATLFAKGVGPAFRVTPPPVALAVVAAGGIGVGGEAEAVVADSDEVADLTGAARFSRSTGAFRPDPAVHVAYFRDLDDWSSFNATPAVRAAVTTALTVVGRAWARYVKGAITEQDYLTAVSTDDVRAAVTLLAQHQQQTVEEHYGVPVPLLALLDGYERFGNDGLPPDPLRPAEPRHNMDSPQMWFVLAGFAETCLRLSIAADFWTFMQRPILCGLLNDGLFRRRFVVQGFEATDAGRQQVFEHAQEVADADLSTEIRQRYLDSRL